MFGIIEQILLDQNKHRNYGYHHYLEQSVSLYVRKFSKQQSNLFK